MKQLIKLMIHCVAACACVSVFGYSNPIEGGTSELVTNQWDVAVPWLMVGSNSGSNSLIVTEDGQVNSQVGIIGNNAGSTNNMVMVSGSGAEWNSAVEISVGNLGSGNALGMVDGGRVDTANAYIGNASSNNYAVVYGEGSELSASTLHVGHTGADNLVGVIDGGTLSTDTASLGHWIGSDGNSVLMMGTNALWNNTGTLNVGEHGANNSLIIMEEGLVQSPVVNLGVHSYSSNNTLSVFGENAQLDAPELNIGGTGTTASGIGNSVSVSDGGTIVTTDLTIHAGNNLDLDDGGTFAINNDFDASLDGFNFNEGGTLEVGGELTGMGADIDAGRTLVLNGANAAWDMGNSTIYFGESGSGDASMIITNGAVVNSGAGYLGYRNYAQDNSVVIAGSGSRWNIENSLVFGGGGGGNTLQIMDGGVLTGQVSVVGLAWGRNEVLVAGDESTWTNSGRMTVGYTSSGNVLSIKDAGVVYAGDGLIGERSSGSNNDVTVAGDGSKWIIENELTIGDYARGNTLLVSSGAVVRAANTYIGRNDTSANSNEVSVRGAGSVLDAGGRLDVGHIGSSNELLIEDGGLVQSEEAYIGYDGQAYAARGNSATVSGEDSIWDNSGDLVIGFLGDENSLIITNGGAVHDSIGMVGTMAGADRNSVLVTDEGSVWQNSDGLYLGGHYEAANWVDGGTGNSLTVEDGGLVLVGDVNTNNLPNVGTAGGIVVGDSSGGVEMVVANQSVVVAPTTIIGLGDGESGSVLIDNGSTWTSDGTTYVGYEGAGSSVTLSDGGALFSSVGYIGYANDASRNAVNVSGENSVWQSREALYLGGHESGSEWVNAGTNNSLTIGARGWVAVGDVDPYSLPIYYQSGVLAVGDTSGNAKMIIANGSTVDTGVSYIGYGANESGSATVRGSGSVWQNLYDVNVGYRGNGSSLLIEGGGVVNSREDGYVGHFSDDNTATVSGTGSVWKSSYTFEVGGSGSENTLMISDGGMVSNNKGYIGHEAGADMNQVSVTGAGSVWTNRGDLAIGWQGGGNSLSITDGGMVYSDEGIIGGLTVANGNSASVSGEGSVWTTESDLRIGYYGTDNELSISDGGSVHSGSYVIMGTGNDLMVSGSGSQLYARYQVKVGSNNDLTVTAGGKVTSGSTSFSSSGNNLTVSGEGSILTNSSSLYVDSDDNHISILDGGAVYSQRGIIQAANNKVLVSGAGSTWSNGELEMGGQGNTLTITNGGVVYSESGSISGSNQALVSGQGSEWRNETDLTIDSGGTFEVSDQGAVYSANSTIGYRSLNSTASITGTGSVWTNSGKMVIGDYGTRSNVLMISNGASVYAGSGVVGNQATSGNIATVTGTDSRWEIADDLTIGRYKASDNKLIVSAGGFVSSQNGILGDVENGGDTADGNQIVVTGENSVWTNRGSLYVGNAGYENRLLIDDGGVVYNEHGYIGYEQYVFNQQPSSNEVVVSGAGSEWINHQNLYVGYQQSGNMLTITNGGVVSDVDGYIGYVSSRDNYGNDNSALVSGAGSTWNNSGSLVIGMDGSNNGLTITNGGTVYNVEGTIGFNSDGNKAVVSGAGSYWSNAGELVIGRYGSGNVMRMEDGGVVQTRGNAYIGYGASANSNSVTVAGKNSAWGVGVMVPRQFVLNPSTNYYRPGQGYSDGSVIQVGDTFVGGDGSDNVLIVTNGGSIATGGEGLYVSTGNQLTVSEGSFVGGTAGYAGSSVLTGEGLYLDPVTDITISNGIFNPPLHYMIEGTIGDLAVGYEGSYNTLDIEGGGLVASWNAYIGETSNAWMNAVSVTGSNSEFHVYRDLSLGGRMSPMYVMTSNGWNNDWIDGGRGNSLYVGEGAIVNVGRDLQNRNYSSINIDPGASIHVASNYYQDATSSLRFGVETNAAGAPVNALVNVGGTAEFEEGARIEYASNIGQLEFDTFYTNKIIAADKLIVAGVEGADSLDLEMLDASGTLVDVIFWENDADIYGLVGRRHLADSAGFTSNSMMEALSAEIDGMSLLGDPGANGMINLLNTMSGSQQAAQMEQQYSRGVPAYQHSRSMTEGLNEIKKHTASKNQMRQSEPVGAKGPYRADQELQGWIKPYGLWADHAAQDGFSGYDQSVYGTVVGLDLPLQTALVGVAGGYGQSRLSQDDGDESTAQTGYGVIYVNGGTDAWFFDVNMGFGRSSIEQESGTEFDSSADYDASNFALQIGGGKEMEINRSWAFTPKASALWTYYYQEAYTETSSQGVGRMVDAYERNSLLTRLGAAVSWRKELKKMTLKPEARLYWLHEFNDDEGQVDYELANGLGGEYHFLMAAPEADVLEAGLGITCILNDDLQLVLDVDGRFGEDYSAYALSGRAVVEF